MHRSHQAGVVCSGQRLEQSTEAKLTTCLRVGYSGYTRLVSSSRFSVLVTDLHFPHSVIFCCFIPSRSPTKELSSSCCKTT